MRFIVSAILSIVQIDVEIGWLSRQFCWEGNIFLSAARIGQHAVFVMNSFFNAGLFVVHVVKRARAIHAVVFECAIGGLVNESPTNHDIAARRALKCEIRWHSVHSFHILKSPT